MSFVLQPWQLLLVLLAGWINKQQQEIIENRRGKEPPWNQEYFGCSYFVGPNGRCANISTHPNLIVSQLDLGELASRDPSGWNLLIDRHDDL